MSEDYLWDRTGEADAELLRLEQKLGALRYRPAPLALPPHASGPTAILPRRSFLRPALALAASLVFLCGLGWFLTRTIGRQRESAARVKSSDANRNVPQPDSTPSKDMIVTNDTSGRPPAATIIPAPRSVAARRPRPRALPPERKAPPAPDEESFASALSASERERGAAAKEKLMLALRIASLELRDVRRKIYADSSSADLKNK
ncbi:MAG TPA: hypothetical protein VM870_11030 [Pyrinomonadaceae bacterium]|nr:hypothetical protein [Pyrinomonadaceae bacterium]